MNKPKEPILSVCIVTYGQEKYIAEAIDSVLMQETDYPFEILVAEDCSPDGTREILQGYEKKYPGRFQMLYLDENTFHTTNNAFTRLEKIAKGKYLIVLEGDDFWTDKHKIDKQIRFLENHDEYIAVAHNAVVVGEDSQPIDEKCPECHENEYRIEYFYNRICLPGQTTTMMYRNPFFNGIDYSLMEKGLMPADWLKVYILINSGKIYCMQETMSAYRHVVVSGTSFSATYKFGFEEQDRWYNELVEYVHNNSSKYQLLCIEFMRFLEIRRGIHEGAMPYRKILETNHYSSSVDLIKMYVKRWIRKHILKDKFIIA